MKGGLSQYQSKNAFQYTLDQDKYIIIFSYCEGRYENFNYANITQQQILFITWIDENILIKHLI